MIRRNIIEGLKKKSILKNEICYCYVMYPSDINLSYKNGIFDIYLWIFSLDLSGHV